MGRHKRGWFSIRKKKKKIYISWVEMCEITKYIQRCCWYISYDDEVLLVCV